VYSGYQTLDELFTPSTEKGELMQMLCAVVVVTISTYLKIFKEGYTFNLPNFSKSKSFLLTSVIAVILITLGLHSFNTNYNLASFIFMTIAVILSTFILILISNKRERLQYEEQSR
jgi:undecaprenyl pyrophosphate phosphatase UppP